MQATKVKCAAFKCARGIFIHVEYYWSPAQRVEKAATPFWHVVQCRRREKRPHLQRQTEGMRLMDAVKRTHGKWLVKKKEPSNENIEMRWPFILRRVCNHLVKSFGLLFPPPSHTSNISRLQGKKRHSRQFLCCCCDDANVTKHQGITEKRFISFFGLFFFSLPAPSLYIDGLPGSGHPAGHTERRRRRRSADTRRRNGPSFVQGQRIPATSSHLETRRRPGHSHPQWIPPKTERFLQLSQIFFFFFFCCCLYRYIYIKFFKK